MLPSPASFTFTVSPNLSPILYLDLFLLIPLPVPHWGGQNENPPLGSTFTPSMELEM